MGKATEQTFRSEGANAEKAAESFVAMGGPKSVIRKALEESGLQAGEAEGLDKESTQRVVNEMLAIFDEHTGTDAASFDEDGDDGDDIDALLGALEDEDSIDGPRTLNRYL